MTLADLPAQSVYDFQDALRLFRQNAEQRREALRDWQKAIQVAADKEAAYRRAYAEAIVKAEGTEKVREASAKAAVALQEAERNVSRDLKDVCRERVRGLEGERANINGLVDWSKRLEPGVGS